MAQGKSYFPFGHAWICVCSFHICGYDLVEISDWHTTSKYFGSLVSFFIALQLTSSISNRVQLTLITKYCFPLANKFFFLNSFCLFTYNTFKFPSGSWCIQKSSYISSWYFVHFSPHFPFPPFYMFYMLLFFSPLYSLVKPGLSSFSWFHFWLIFIIFCVCFTVTKKWSISQFWPCMDLMSLRKIFCFHICLLCYHCIRYYSCLFVYFIMFVFLYSVQT